MLERMGTGEKLSLAWITFLGYISFAYYTKTDVEKVFFENNIGFPSGFDLPVIFQLVIFLWVLLISIQWTIVYLQKTSDIIIAEGQDYPDSCIAADLENQIMGDLAFIKVGGTKDIPVRGSSVWINPTTHIHRFNNCLVFSGKVEQNTELRNVPLDLKTHVRQRRNSDFIELIKCSVGYLTSHELDRNVEFSRADYEEFLDGEYKNMTHINTNTFLIDLRILNREYDVPLQSNENENTAMTDHLRTQVETGKALQNMQEKGFWSQLGIS